MRVESFYLVKHHSSLSVLGFYLLKSENYPQQLEQVEYFCSVATLK